MSAWRRRMAQDPDCWPSLPLRPGPASNGEYVPPPRTASDRALERAILDRAATAADRIGMDRRRFLQTSGGIAAALATFNLAACSGGDGETAPTTSRAPTTTTTDPGGSFEVSEPEEVEACEQELAGTGELIFDIHTHHVVPDGPWRQNAQRIADMILGLVPAGCAEADPYRCVDRTAYLHDMFLASDTTITLLSDVPNSGPLDAPMPWAEKRETRQLAESLAAGGEARVLLHDVIAPNFGDLAMRLDEMERNAGTGDVAAFKVYTAWGPEGRGYALDDPAIGLPVVEKARELGVRVICAHKGLPLLEFDRAHNGPADLVATAKQYPDMDFIVYHGAYELQTTEGPYDPTDAARGVNSLIKALDDHGIAPNANVHAELGTTWRETLARPTEAAHLLGKLLSRVGTDNVMWGTDAVWYGSPQPQIMAFRAFQISPELQERFGYPALTPELKAKVFGLNAARVFGVDPAAARCAVDGDGLAEARARLASYVRDGAVEPWQARGPMTRRQVLTWLRSAPEPWTPA
ncbi:MAG: amidohydrolase family protein [Acidimicrobiales bacterium]